MSCVIKLNDTSVIFHAFSASEALTHNFLFIDLKRNCIVWSPSLCLQRSGFYKLCNTHADKMAV